MTRWADIAARSQESPLMGILPALDPVDSTSERYKTTSAELCAGQGISSTSTITSGEDSSPALVESSEPAYPTCTSSSCEPSSSSACSTSTYSRQSTSTSSSSSKSTTIGLGYANPENGVSASGTLDGGGSVVSSNTNCRDVYSKAIPLPAPPSSTYSMGVACGGNQSYVGLKDSRLTRLQECRPTSPPFGNMVHGTFGTRPGMMTFNNNSSLAPTRPAGVVGLMNLGNTCFMNSGLQCLFNTPSLVEYFIRCGNISGGPKERGLAFEFQNLVKNVWYGNTQTIQPKDFKMVLGNIYSQFKDCRQHDCQEFLISTLDVLHEQLKQWNNLKRQDNECGSSTITTSGRSDTSSGIYSACASDTDISSSQTSPGETPCDPHSGCPRSKKRKLGVAASLRSGEERSSVVVEDIKSIPSVSEEDSGNESIGKGSNCNDPHYQEDDEEETILGLDINHDRDEETNSRSDVIDVEVDSDHEMRGEDSHESLVKEAENFWIKYIRENNTVIASSFQGMYKSTVTCSVCHYVSRTYEPFMYLSLPIPRIMERQLSVTFCSINEAQPKKVDVTMNTGDTVGRLKEEVLKKAIGDSEWGSPLTTLIVAEVVNHHVSRILGDDIALKNVNDGNRSIYVFELNQDFDDLSSTMYDTNIEENKSCNGFGPSSPFSGQVLQHTELLRPMTYLEEDWETDAPVFGPAPAPADYLEQQSSENYPPPKVTLDMYDQPSDEMYLQNDQLSSEDYPQNVEPQNEVNAEDDQPIDENYPQHEQPADEDYPQNDQSSNAEYPQNDQPIIDEYPQSNQSANEAYTQNVGMDCDQQNLESMELIQCAVCLEDCFKSNLRQHFGCACILCLDCMGKTAIHFVPSSKTTSEASKNEETSKLLKCPVCAEEVEYEKYFMPLVEASMSEGDAPPKKLHLVPLLFRHHPDTDTNNNGFFGWKLIGHPWVVKLPSTIPALEFHSFINRINPFPDHNFRVLTSSWDGKSCGQCMYPMCCRGCELPSEGIISINPRNSIMISYSNLSSDLVDSIHPLDMAICQNTWHVTQREEPIVDIHECLAAFSETESLDDQNPTWYCPNCKENRCATKALTVCRVPDYLIVYLKRFVFMDHTSNKLNNRLRFPLTDLDVTSYIAEEFAGDQHIYDLYACVCHYGSSSNGHYTAFGKNPETGLWNCFNDSSVNPKVPSEEEFSSAYVLFYARKGLKCDIPTRNFSSPLFPSNPNNFRFDPASLGGHKDACDSTSVLPDLENSSVQMSSGTDPNESIQLNSVSENNEMMENDMMVGCLAASSDPEGNNEGGLDSTTTTETPVLNDKSYNCKQSTSSSFNDSSTPSSTTTSSADTCSKQFGSFNDVHEDVSNLHLCSSSSDEQNHRQSPPLKRKIPSRPASSSATRFCAESLEAENSSNVLEDDEVKVVDDEQTRRNGYKETCSSSTTTTSVTTCPSPTTLFNVNTRQLKTSSTNINRASQN